MVSSYSSALPLQPIAIAFQIINQLFCNQATCSTNDVHSLSIAFHGNLDKLPVPIRKKHNRFVPGQNIYKSLISEITILLCRLTSDVNSRSLEALVSGSAEILQPLDWPKSLVGKASGSTTETAGSRKVLKWNTHFYESWSSYKYGFLINKIETVHSGNQMHAPISQIWNLLFFPLNWFLRKFMDEINDIIWCSFN